MEETIDNPDDLACLIDDFSNIDENEFWAIWNSNNEQNTKKRSEEDAKNEEEDSNVAAKRKQEVLSILSGYRNDIKNKKKQRMDSCQKDDATFSIDDVLNDMKKKRLEAFDPVIAAFNVGDFEMMGDVLKDKCDENVILSSQLLSTDSIGRKPLLLFWGLLHETYPDAMIQILETRLSTVSRALFHSDNKKAANTDTSNNTSNNSGCDSSSSSSGGNDGINSNNSSGNSSILAGTYHSVEYVYKFTGTRITDRPVAQTFNKLIESGILNDSNVNVNTNEALTNVISKFMTSADLPPASYVAHGCSYVIETVLTFNQQNKIIKWSYGILAAEIN